MNLIQMWDLDNNPIDFEKYGIIGLALIPEAPSYALDSETMPGMAGAISLGKQLNPRNIEARFLMQSYDYADSLLQRDELYRLLNGDESFYIGEVNQPGKRWLVESTEAWTPDRLNVMTLEFSLNLIALSGRAESIGTSTDPKTFDVELWQMGQGLMAVDYEYVHNTTAFDIYNAGNQVVDPRNVNTEIRIIVKADASDYIEIINKTTNETYRYNGKLTTNDTLLLDGIRSTKNGLSVFRSTSKKLLRLNPGVNKIEIKGTNNIESITFDFRFYYA